MPAFAGASPRAEMPAFAGASASAGRAAYAGARGGARPVGKRIFPRARQRRRVGWGATLARIATLPGLGGVLVLAFLAGVGLYGAQRGGQYDAFVKVNGAPADIVARALGLGLDTVTITGQIELSETQILKGAGLNGLQSLPFLDADAVRARLMTMPLVKNVHVRKLLPSRLIIEINERTPYAVWQRDGAVSIVAADGAPIDEFRDARYTRLPFVVGEGANQRIDDYVALLEASGDLRAKVRAGVLVSKRRWTLTMTNGVDVLLPENDAASALRQLARLENESRILEKDIVSLDFRTPGRLFVRLTEEAAAARAAAHAPRKGAPK
ncbi:cell division protein FtsQ [Rhodoblastus sphagnicola]|nr:cell division protein FtsQ [Rhodoblastus sphagnicola]